MENVLDFPLIVLWLQFGLLSGEDRVEQHPQILRPQEGDRSSLNCSYSVSNFQGLQWYRQDPGKGPELLLLLYSVGDEKQKERLTATLSKKESFLHISDSTPEDSATYFCAARNNNAGSALTFGGGTRLMVKPLIHQPDPSVYKLRGPKSSNTSVCLLTDFASQDNVTQEMKHMVFRSGSTALDVKAMDSKSNGALAWSNSINFQCNSTFETYAFYPSSEYSCDAKLVEKSFETDMNLNFQNLSVIALRILLLKVAGFNLLMTLRLWSS